jgi:hypothetical protein
MRGGINVIFLGGSMVTIVELVYPNETLWGVEYDGEVKITASTPERAQELADELFGVLE